MSRVLHVFDQPGQTPHALLLRMSLDVSRRGASDANDKHAWLLIGGEPLLDAAVSVGIARARCRLVARPRGLRRVRLGRSPEIVRLLGEADRVVCWGKHAAELIRGFGFDGEVAMHDPAGVDRLAGECIDPSGVQLPADELAAGGPDREAMRASWGAVPESVVVALLADEPGQMDAVAATMTAGLTCEALSAAGATCCDIRVLCHPAAKARLEANALADLLQVPNLLVHDSRLLTPWRCLTGCDLAMAPAPKHAPLSIRWATAMGLRVVVPQAYEPAPGVAAEALISARSHEPKRLAHALTQWVLAEAATAGSAAMT